MAGFELKRRGVKGGRPGCFLPSVEWFMRLLLLLSVLCVVCAGAAPPSGLPASVSVSGLSGVFPGSFVCSWAEEGEVLGGSAGYWFYQDAPYARLSVVPSNGEEVGLGSWWDVTVETDSVLVEDQAERVSEGFEWGAGGDWWRSSFGSASVVPEAGGLSALSPFLLWTQRRQR